MNPPMGDPHARGGFPDVLVNKPPTAASTVKLNLERLPGQRGPKDHPSAQWFVDKTLRLSVCVAREPFERSDGGAQRIKVGTHISVSSPDRYPTWDELVAVKRCFAPNLELAIYLPPDEDYVNVHPNCFHMWEV